MSLVRVNGAGWSLGASFTSAEANGIDINVTNALDKRSGQTDTLASIVTCSGAGRLIPTYIAGADSNTTYTLSTGISIINASTGLTAAREYTLSNTGAAAGDSVTVLAGTQDVTVKNAAGTALIVLGATSSGTNSSKWAEFLHNGSAWVLFKSSESSPQQLQIFTINGSFTVPPGIRKLVVMGCGAGGGGGGGAGGNNSSSTTLNATGGGGGGAAIWGVTFVDTTPGAVFAVTLGTAGTAGTAGDPTGGPNVGGDGGDGTSTTFGSAISFRGAQGGLGGEHAGVVSTFNNFAPGGGPVQGGVKGWRYGGASGALAPPWGVKIPGEGGYGGSKGGSGNGTGAGSSGNHAHLASTTAGSGTTTPGSGGSQGTAASGSLGGGGGGGGGASSVGNGGNGANGGNAASGSPGVVGGTGSVGGVGAGGGGGGGGGNGNTGAFGGPGGAGGAGVLVVIPIR